MPGLGTIINVAAIIAGGLAGILFGNKLKEHFRETLIHGIGVATLFLGAGGVMRQMLVLKDGTLETQGTMMLIVCLALGAVCGEALQIEEHIEQFGEWLKKKTGNAKDAGFVHAFLTASLTVCIGAMAVVGSVEDGIRFDPSILEAKAILDFIIVMVMAASMGKGCLFSFVPVGIFQGTITLLAFFIGTGVSPEALNRISYVGNALIFCVGTNLVWGRRIRVGNLLPSLIFAILWGLLPLG
ncbi:MAG: DUF554 domain-containing protein [Erysipelotrichales bacterium]|nr:DUF554 domain-containing protein [Erysipelotrichales bacterium]MBQ5543002.1 DUF554 domain-containing protein [Erysipelotrichales bacterium]